MARSLVPKRFSVALFALAWLLALVAAAQPPTNATTPSSDPFAALTAVDRREAALVPPRTLAVIPERHAGRPIRFVDALVSIDPQFDDFARGAGLTGRTAIQIRTREAHVPIFAAKSDSMVSTLLQIALGANVEVQGVLVERSGRYFFLASDVRAAAPRARPATPSR